MGLGGAGWGWVGGVRLQTRFILSKSVVEPALTTHTHTHTHPTWSPHAMYRYRQTSTINTPQGYLSQHLNHRFPHGPLSNPLPRRAPPSPQLKGVSEEEEEGRNSCEASSSADLSLSLGGERERQNLSTLIQSAGHLIQADQTAG